MDDQLYRKFLEWERATRDTIDFKKIYVDMAGDVLAGLVLSEIVFWHLPNQRGEAKMKVQKKGFEWIACSRAEWWDRTRLSPRQFDTAMKYLTKANLVFKATFHFAGNRMLHVRINWDAFFVLWNSLNNAPLENPYRVNHQTVKSEKPSHKSPIGNLQNGDLQITKNDICLYTEVTDREEKEKDSAQDKSAAVETATSDTLTQVEAQLAITTPSEQSVDDITSHSPSGNVEVKNPSPPNGAKPPSPQKAKQTALHDALLTSFSLKAETLTRSEDRKYWTAAAELARIDFPSERIHELYWYIRRKADVQGWKTWTVMALVNRAGEFIRDNPTPKITVLPEPESETLAPAAGAENVRDYSVEGKKIMDALIASKRGRK